MSVIADLVHLLKTCWLSFWLRNMKQSLMYKGTSLDTRTKRADLQQICNRSVLTKTDQLQTNLSSAESVFSLLQMLSLNTLRDFKTADEKHTNNRSADYLLRLQMICNTMKSKYRIDIPFIVSRLRYKPQVDQSLLVRFEINKIV